MRGGPITGQHSSHVTITLQRRRQWHEKTSKTTKNKTLHSNFKYLETIKMDKTYMNWFIWLWYRRCHGVWSDWYCIRILEIGKLKAFGLTPASTPASTSASTPGCMLPSSELVFSDISPPSFWPHSNRPPLIIIVIRRRNNSNIQLMSLLHKSRKREIVIIKSSHYENYQAKDIHPIATRFN